MRYTMNLAWICCILLFLFDICWVSGTTTSSIECYQAKSCASQDLYLSSSSYFNPPYIKCYGYQSCIDDTAIEVQSYPEIFCDGSYSCYNAAEITHSSADSKTYCYGLLSCANVIDMEGETYCSGDQSCKDSKITTDYYTYCNGDRSCSGTQIVVAEEVNFKGAYSGLNALIYNDGGYHSFNFFGYNSGYNATFIYNSYVEVYCYGNACNNLTLTCQTGAQYCSLHVSCDGAMKSTICPNGMYINDLLLPHQSLHV